jgi:hypothetical protein
MSDQTAPAGVMGELNLEMQDRIAGAFRGIPGRRFLRGVVGFATGAMASMDRNIGDFEKADVLIDGR